MESFTKRQKMTQVNAKDAYDMVMKDLVYSFFLKLKVTNALYKITEGVRYNHYFGVCFNEPSEFTSVFQDKYGSFQLRIVDREYLFQPFVKFQVYHDYCYDDIDGKKYADGDFQCHCDESDCDESDCDESDCDEECDENEREINWNQVKTLFSHWITKSSEFLSHNYWRG